MSPGVANSPEEAGAGCTVWRPWSRPLGSSWGNTSSCPSLPPSGRLLWWSGAAWAAGLRPPGESRLQRGWHPGPSCLPGACSLPLPRAKQSPAPEAERRGLQGERGVREELSVPRPGPGPTGQSQSAHLQGCTGQVPAASSVLQEAAPAPLHGGAGHGQPQKSQEALDGPRPRTAGPLHSTGPQGDSGWTPACAHSSPAACSSRSGPQRAPCGRRRRRRRS